MGTSSFLEAAASPLRLSTYDGSGQCVHPDVVRTDRSYYDRDLLMAIEPYPYANESFENPSLLCSDDGKCWQTPRGVTNPIVEAPSQHRSWNSDADLVISQDGRLLLYYRFNSGNGETTLFRKETKDGFNWTPPKEIFTVAVSGSFASPAFVLQENLIYMYYVDTLKQCVRLSTSKDGITWGSPRKLFGFYNAWHIDALCTGEWIYLLLNDKKFLYLLRTRDQHSWYIYDACSWQSYPSADCIENTKRTPILGPSENSWDSELIYRSTFLIEEKELRLWYGAKSKANEWAVGYTSGALYE